MAEKAEVKVLYDKKHDILSLFREGDKSKFSFELELPQGEVVIDYNFESKIAGIEFFNASSYFSQLR